MSLAPPAPGGFIEVAEGVMLVRMPLPFALDHVNLWALADGDGWTIVDTGIADERTRAHWESHLSGFMGGRKVKRLICTHFHPDHMDLCGWFAQRFAIPVTISRGEWRIGQMAWAGKRTEGPSFLAEHYRRAGFPEPAMRRLGSRPPLSHPTEFPLPATETIADGDVVTIGARRWRVIACGGHSPEHACLWSEDDHLLIAGDQVLPRITPIIGVWPQEPEAEPLSLFLSALDRLRHLPDDTLVLPSHEDPFRTLRARCRTLTEHHGKRLQRVTEACRTGATLWQVQQALFTRPLDGWQIALACAETLAHLNHLLAQGQISRREGVDGVWIFEALAPDQ